MTKNKNILYVEDNLDIAESVKIILSSLGHNISIANTGKEGLALLKKNLFDLVIFDIMLPDISGIDLFDKTHKYHKDKKTSCKYVFLSILNIPAKEKAELTERGVADYITKPFNKEDLIKRISESLN